MTRRRLVIGAATVVAIAGAGVLFANLVLPLVNVGTAYKAKMLCSEVFVAGRRPDDVAADLATVDLRALRLISASVDTAAKTTTSRLFPFRARRARYSGDRGCTLDAHRPVATTSSQRELAPRGGRDTVVALEPTTRAALERVLDDAFSEPDSTRLRRTRAVVVMRQGAVVAERYAPGVTSETPLPGWSMAKSVLNALIGIAVREGKLALDRPTTLKAWSSPGDPRGQISVSDLLRMSSGLAFEEGQSDPSSDLLEMLFETSDMGGFAAAHQLDTVPGTRWRYSTGTAMILSRVLREALGDSTYRRFPRMSLFDPLEMTHAVLEADESGTYVASSYMYATAREWGRLGQLYLQDGVWNGRRILPEGWVAYTRTPAPAAPPGTYGAHFWLATPREYRGPPAEVPAGVFQAVGHEGQFVTVVPSHDVVIVRLGRTRVASAWAHDRFIRDVLAALRP